MLLPTWFWVTLQLVQTANCFLLNGFVTKIRIFFLESLKSRLSEQRNHQRYDAVGVRSLEWSTTLRKEGNPAIFLVKDQCLIRVDALTVVRTGQSKKNVCVLLVARTPLPGKFIS